MKIELGDFGIVLGRQGVWCVHGGAKLPDNITACSASAIRSAEEAEALSVYQIGHGSEMVWRSEFVPLHFATDEQKQNAGIPSPIWR